MHGNWMIEVKFELDDFRSDYLGQKKKNQIVFHFDFKTFLFDIWNYFGFKLLNFKIKLIWFWIIYV